MGHSRRDDESVQTSLRALMEQEDERVRAENERLEQLRAAKIRLDHERAEAAREEEERRALEREAVKAAAVERARIEALAKAEADRRAEERTRTKIIEPVAPPLPKARSHVGTWVLVGVMSAALAAGATWLFIGAPRVQRESQRASSAWSEAEAARTRAHDAESALAEEHEARRKETDALRDENGRLRTAAANLPKCAPVTTPPMQTDHTTRARCDPHDPLCADL